MSCSVWEEDSILISLTEKKHPWIFPNDHRYTKMLVQYQHEQIMHVGVWDTLVQTREKYWILRARQVVKKVVSRCVLCKNFNAKAGQQTTALLPKAIWDGHCRATLCEDTKLHDKNVHSTVYLCGNLELVSDLSTENFLLALKRFISRRGLCKVIYSDNAKTFKRADQDLKELRKSIKDPQLRELVSEKGITWRFNAERAALWGGNVHHSDWNWSHNKF